MKEKVIIFTILLMILGITFTAIFVVKNNNEEKIRQEQKTLEKEVKSHYNDYVITTISTKLYKKENDKYIESGSVSGGVNLTLIKEEINYNTKYFLIDGLNMYISYEDVKPTEQYKIEDSYKKYIRFNLLIHRDFPGVRTESARRR